MIHVNFSENRVDYIFSNRDCCANFVNHQQRYQTAYVSFFLSVRFFNASKFFRFVETGVLFLSAGLVGSYGT